MFTFWLMEPCQALITGEQAILLRLHCLIFHSLVFQVCFSLWQGSSLITTCSPDFCNLSSFAILRWLWKSYDKLLIFPIYACKPHWVGFILNTFWNHISTFRSANYFLINYCLTIRCYFKYMKESSFQMWVTTSGEE